MNMSVEIEAFIAILTLLGVLWRVADGILTKNEYRRQRAEDDKMRIERQKYIDEALARAEAGRTELIRIVTEINGTVKTHTQWIRDHEQIHHPRKR